MVDQTFILDLIKAIFSWPFVILVVIVLFFKQLKSFFDKITRGASFRAGEFELALNNNSSHSNTSIISLPSTKKEESKVVSSFKNLNNVNNIYIEMEKFSL